MDHTAQIQGALRLMAVRLDHPLDPDAAELLPTGDNEEDAGAALDDVPPPEDELVDIIPPMTPTVQVLVRDGS